MSDEISDVEKQILAMRGHKLLVRRQMLVEDYFEELCEAGGQSSSLADQSEYEKACLRMASSTGIFVLVLLVKESGFLEPETFKRAKLRRAFKRKLLTATNIHRLLAGLDEDDTSIQSKERGRVTRVLEAMTLLELAQKVDLAEDKKHVAYKATQAAYDLVIEMGLDVISLSLKDSEEEGLEGDPWAWREKKA